MMAQSTPFIVLVAALLISTLSYCSAEKVYCVTPTAACSSCPHNSTHCATLSEYAQEAELYFTSNTAVVFLPGDHALDTNITVANVTRLTMCGESSLGNRATVVCRGSVGLSFTSMVEIKIYYLVFTSCSRKYAITLSGTPPTCAHVGMFLQFAQDAELVNCSFQANLGTALAVSNTSITLSGNCDFAYNHLLCGYSIAAGGGIIAVSSNLTFTGNTTFLDNGASCTASFGGAIIILDNTVVSFNGTSNFINNSASQGGAIFASGHTVLSFSGTNNFINNSAGDIGGTISTYNNTVLSFSGTNNFINNSAGDIGGAISTYNNTVLSFNGTNNFINNLAHYGGGAILMLKNALLCLNGTSNFINNSASEGGAICTLDIAVLSFNGTSKFINNTAGYGGGAIFAVINSTLTVNGTIYFTNNGHYGGGVHTQNGDVYTAYGGGVYIGLISTFSILPNTSVYWENNHATLGGAIYVYDDNPRSDCAFFASYATIVPKEECFFQLPGQNLSDGVDV